MNSVFKTLLGRIGLSNPRDTIRRWLWTIILGSQIIFAAHTLYLLILTYPTLSRETIGYAVISIMLILPYVLMFLVEFYDRRQVAKIPSDVPAEGVFKSLKSAFMDGNSGSRPASAIFANTTFVDTTDDMSPPNTTWKLHPEGNVIIRLKFPNGLGLPAASEIRYHSDLECILSHKGKNYMCFFVPEENPLPIPQEGEAEVGIWFLCKYDFKSLFQEDDPIKLVGFPPAGGVVVRVTDPEPEPSQEVANG